MPVFREYVSFIWSVADFVRGDHKTSEYGRVILPLTVLRRLDCVLEPSKALLLERAADPAMQSLPDPDAVLAQLSHLKFITGRGIRSRYYAHLLRTPAFVDGMRRRLRGMGVSIWEPFAPLASTWPTP